MFYNLFHVTHKLHSNLTMTCARMKCTVNIYFLILFITIYMTYRKGLSYSNYLQLLLWTMQDQRLAERGMDMMEKNTGVQMDSLVSRAECSYTFEAPAVFWSFITLGQHSFGTYQIEEEAEISFCAETE